MSSHDNSMFGNQFKYILVLTLLAWITYTLPAVKAQFAPVTDNTIMHAIEQSENSAAVANAQTTECPAGYVCNTPTTPQPTNGPCYTFSTNLFYGAGIGDVESLTNEVQRLQIFLQKQGYKIDLDEQKGGSIFGMSTLRAVLAFQKKYGLVSNGYVGPTTRAKMQSVCEGSVQPIVKVVSPNGGETYKVGDVVKVSWTTKGAQNKGNVQLSVDSKNGSSAITNKIFPLNGYYNWTIPASLSPGQYKIRAVVLGGGYNPTPEDSSDGEFTVVGVPVSTNSIEVKAPNANTVVTVGVPTKVVWWLKGVVKEPLFDIVEYNAADKGLIVSGLTFGQANCGQTAVEDGVPRYTCAYIWRPQSASEKTGLAVSMRGTIASGYSDVFKINASTTSPISDLVASNLSASLGDVIVSGNTPIAQAMAFSLTLTALGDSNMYISADSAKALITMTTGTNAASSSLPMSGTIVNPGTLAGDYQTSASSGYYVIPAGTSRSFIYNGMIYSNGIAGLKTFSITGLTYGTDPSAVNSRTISTGLENLRVSTTI